jgi:hypothetical protein
VAGHAAEELPVIAKDESMLGLAQPDSALGKGFENGLQIECGPADNLQQLAGRGLLFKGNPQFRIARLHLIEQPRVFDGDYSLVRKGLK